MRQIVTRKGTAIQDPPFVKTLLNDTRFSVLWLVLRVWLGYQWLHAGLGKLGNPAWVDGGAALKGFWSSIVVVPADGRPPIAFDWYRNFIQFMLDAEAYTWFAKIVAYSETIIGIALILGLFTGIAAFAGGFMNWNFMMAGSASTNPMLFTISVGLILAWKIAGYLGADYFLLPLLGTPWSGEKVEEVETGESREPSYIPEPSPGD